MYYSQFMEKIRYKMLLDNIIQKTTINFDIQQDKNC